MTSWPLMKNVRLLRVIINKFPSEIELSRSAKVQSVREGKCRIVGRVGVAEEMSADREPREKKVLSGALGG